MTWLAALVAMFCLGGGAQARSLQQRSAAACGHNVPACSYPPDVDRWAETPPHLRPCFSRDDCDRKAFDESGTRGRMGLGADPAHPEGPGNFSD
ncbi:hypothetical protein [Methylocella silvestris]|uniref:hypothetical protein n=1 Tax=Methylocella silvestris TaxID=199596 RepID=UPI00059C1262|nr:hypothetical protein [Methylocella silvestris]